MNMFENMTLEEMWDYLTEAGIATEELRGIEIL